MGVTLTRLNPATGEYECIDDSCPSSQEAMRRAEAHFVETVGHVETRGRSVAPWPCSEPRPAGLTPPRHNFYTASDDDGSLYHLLEYSAPGVAGRLLALYRIVSTRDVMDGSLSHANDARP